MDEMIQFYYYEVKELLIKLDYDMKKFPTLQNFQVQVQKKYFYGNDLISFIYVATQLSFFFILQHFPHV